MEREVQCEIVGEGIGKCSMKFSDADVERPLASVSAVVDEGCRVVFELTGSYGDHEVTGRRSRCPNVSRKNGVFVMNLVMRPSTKPSSKSGDEGRRDTGFRWPASGKSTVRPK